MTLFHFFSDQNWFSVFQVQQPLYYQLPAGIAWGILSAYGAWAIINTKILRPTIQKYGHLISQLQLTYLQVVFISFCAGVGEELLFRASIQPFLGVVFTSLLFIALHGYLNPSDWRVSLYGMYMSFVIIVIGWMFQDLGIYAAIIAHIVIDWILLLKLRKIHPVVH